MPLLPRLGSAVVSYASHVIQTLWPTDLSVFYPHPGSNYSVVKVVVFAVLLVLSVMNVTPRHKLKITNQSGKAERLVK